MLGSDIHISYSVVGTLRCFVYYSDYFNSVLLYIYAIKANSNIASTLNITWANKNSVIQETYEKRGRFNIVVPSNVNEVRMGITPRIVLAGITLASMKKDA